MVQVSYMLPGQYLAFLPFGPVCQLCRAGKKLWCPTGTGTEAVETSDGLKQLSPNHTVTSTGCVFQLKLAGMSSGLTNG